MILGQNKPFFGTFLAKFSQNESFRKIVGAVSAKFNSLRIEIRTDKGDITEPVAFADSIMVIKANFQINRILLKRALPIYIGLFPQIFRQDLGGVSENQHTVIHGDNMNRTYRFSWFDIVSY